MTDPDLISRVKAFVTAAHAGQVDKGGKPYVEHPLAVAAAFEDETAVTVALLHDVLEDTACTEADLLALGIGPRALDALRLLTRQKGEDYGDYLRRLAPDPLARAVKCADLRHNADLSRIPSPTARDVARARKYRDALAFLLSFDADAR